MWLWTLFVWILRIDILIAFIFHFPQMFQALARDRLERLNASPSATHWTYFRVYCVLLLVVTVDAVWYLHDNSVIF